MATVKDITINGDGHLVFAMGDGTTIDAGYVLGCTGPRGSRGDVGMRGAAGLDLSDIVTGPAGPTGASIVAVHSTSAFPKSFTMVMSDGRKFTVPVHVSAASGGGGGGPGPGGPTGVGVHAAQVNAKTNTLELVLTDQSVVPVATVNKLRTLGLTPKGAMPVYYDPVADTLYAVRGGTP
jgi:hypothetical protein